MYHSGIVSGVKNVVLVIWDPNGKGDLRVVGKVVQVRRSEGS